MTLRVNRSLIGKEHLRLPSGLYVEREAEVTVEDHPEDGFTLTLTAEFDDLLRRYVARTVSVRSNKNGQEVTGTILRAVRVQQVLQQAGLLLMTKRSDGVSGSEIRVDELFKDYMANSAIHRKSAEVAAEVYEAAVVLNYPPLKTVSDILGISQSTSTRLVARARELKLLEPTNG